MALLAVRPLLDHCSPLRVVVTGLVVIILVGQDRLAAERMGLVQTHLVVVVGVLVDKVAMP